MGLIRSIGKVAVTTAGTPVRATSTQTVPAARIPAHTVFMQALPANTGRIYVGNTSSMSKTTFAGVVGIIPAPSASVATGSLPFFEVTLVPSPNGFNLADFWLDADVSTEGVVIAVTET